MLAEQVHSAVEHILGRPPREPLRVAVLAPPPRSEAELRRPVPSLRSLVDEPCGEGVLAAVKEARDSHVRHPRNTRPPMASEVRAAIEAQGGVSALSGAKLEDRGWGAPRCALEDPGWPAELVRDASGQLVLSKRHKTPLWSGLPGLTPRFCLLTRGEAVLRERYITRWDRARGLLESESLEQVQEYYRFAAETFGGHPGGGSVPWHEQVGRYVHGAPLPACAFVPGSGAGPCGVCGAETSSSVIWHGGRGAWVRTCCACYYPQEIALRRFARAFEAVVRKGEEPDLDAYQALLAAAPERYGERDVLASARGVALLLIDLHCK